MAPPSFPRSGLCATNVTQICVTINSVTSAGATTDGGIDLRVDELARLAGTTTRHVRALQTAGLLPPPALRGRTGLYGPAHLERLGAVLRLQRAGFSLSALRALFDAWEEGLSLDEVLGVPPRADGRPSRGDGEHDDDLGAFADWPTRRGARALAVLPSSLLDQAS
jgi:DNA-binding transcriptional MerR regulator